MTTVLITRLVTPEPGKSWHSCQVSVGHLWPGNKQLPTQARPGLTDFLRTVAQETGDFVGQRGKVDGNGQFMGN